MRIAKYAIILGIVTFAVGVLPPAYADMELAAPPTPGAPVVVPEPQTPPPTAGVQPAACDCELAPHQVCGFVGYIDLLAWKLRDSGLKYAESATGDTTFDEPYVTDGLYVNMPWQAGFRVGLGYRFDSAWDVTWNYTHFYTSGRASAVTDDSQQIVTPGQPEQNFAVGSATALSKFGYNVHDIEFGHWLSFCHNVDVRLFGSFRWAQTRSDFNVDYTSIGGTIGANATVGSRSDMDAYGIRLGAEYRWRIGDTRLSLFARGAGSVLVGNFRTTITTAEMAGDDDLMIDRRRDIHAVPVLEGAAGVAYQMNRWEVSLGYEMTAWFNQSASDNFYTGSDRYRDILLDCLYTRLAFRY